MNRTIVISLAVLACVGCQMDNKFSQLQRGMTKAQVMAIVNKRPNGDKMEGNVEVLHWEAGSHYAKFKDGKLTDYGSD